MGQKTHPLGFRLSISKPHLANWYGEREEFKKRLQTDLRIRKFIGKEYSDCAVSKVEISRTSDRLRITIHTARPAKIAQRTAGEAGKGRSFEALEKSIAKAVGLSLTHLTVVVQQETRPDISARLVADRIAQKLEDRIMYRRAMRQALASAMREGAVGVKVMVSGRLGGVDIARSQVYKEGRVPLHTLRGDMDYAIAEAMTTYGVIGVKVWIYMGDSKHQTRLGRATSSATT